MVHIQYITYKTFPLMKCCTLFSFEHVILLLLGNNGTCHLLVFQLFLTSDHSVHQTALWTIIQDEKCRHSGRATGHKNLC